MTKVLATAHDAVSHAVTRLVERVRAAAYRVVCAHPDDEAIHDFRVALRRLRTVVRASRVLYGKATRRLDAELKRFGDATNALRDAEVLAETLALAALDEPLRRSGERWLEERRKQAEALRADAIAFVMEPELEATLRELSALVSAGAKHETPLADFANRCIAEAQEGVGALLPVDSGDVAALHRLRIRFKRLRYLAEMLNELSGASDKQERRALRAKLERIAREGARMQKVLGRLHDIDDAITSLGASRELELVEQGPLRQALVLARERLVGEAFVVLAALPAEVVPAPERISAPP